MTIPLECACGKLLKVPDEFAGKKIKCSECFQILPVPPAAGQPSLLSREPGDAGSRGIAKTSLEMPDDKLPAPLPMHPRTVLEQPSAENVPPLPIPMRTVLVQPSAENVPPPPIPTRTVLVQPTDGAFAGEPSAIPRRSKPSREPTPPPESPRRSKKVRTPDRDSEHEPSRDDRSRKAEGGTSAVTIAILGVLGVLLLGGGAGGLFWWVSREDTPVAKVTPKEVKPKEEPEKPKAEPDKPKEDPKPPVVPDGPEAVGKMTPEQIYRRLLRSTTWIVAEDGSNGSGVLIDAKERLVLTNHHVIEGSSNPVVYFPAFAGKELITSGQHYLDNARKIGIAASVVWDDPKRDLAVLRLLALPPGIPAVPLARESLSPAARILTIGNSGAKENAMWRNVRGEVRQVSRQVIAYKGQKVEAWIMETDSATNPGDSGGPAVDDRCVLAGLVTGGNMAKRLVSMFIDIREIRTVVKACYLAQYKKEWQDTTPSEFVALDTLPKLLEQLKGSDNKKRAEAARMLGDMGPEARGAVPTLLRVYKLGDLLVNQQILAALEKIGPPEATEVSILLQTLDDTRPETRLYAIRSLTQLGGVGVKGLPSLKKACDDPDPEIRFAALRAFTQLSEEDSLEVQPLALARLKDEVVRIRRLAAIVLQVSGKHARSEVLVPLMTALTDRNPGVVTEVEKALTAISPMTAADVPVLQKALTNANARVRFFGAYSLQLLEAKALPAVAELVQAIEDSDDRVRRAAIGAVGKLGAQGASGISRLLATLVHPDKGLRVAAVEALGSIGRQPGVFPALFTALTDREVEVRATAASALERVGKPDKSDVEGISKFLTSEQSLLRCQAAAALGRLGVEAKGSVPGLARMVREDKSVRARLAAVNALKKIGPDAREASEALALALNDKIAPTEEDLSDLFTKPGIKAGDGNADAVNKGLLRSTVLVGVPQRFGGTVFSSGWVVDTTQRLIVTTSRNFTGASGLVLVCTPDDEKGEVRNQLKHYQENAKRLAMPARVVHADPLRELVILQLVGRMPAIALPLRLAETGAAADQTIHAMGAVNVNPGLGEGTLWTHTSAKVRQISLRAYFAGPRYLRTEARFLETDKQLECDDAGGPVVNDKLELVGMVSGKRDGFSRLPQCMDLSEIKAFLADFGKLGKIDLGTAKGGIKRPTSAGINQVVFRCGVVAALEKTGTDVPDKVVPALVKALADPSPEVQAVAVVTIGSLGGRAKSAYPQLMEMLPRAGADSPVEDALIKMGGEIAPDLAKIVGFNNTKNDVLMACRLLGKMGKEGSPALPILKKNRTEREIYWRRNPEILSAMKATLAALERSK